MAEQLAIIPVLLLLVASLSVLVLRDFRATLAALAVQYLAVFWLVTLVWPVGLAIVKLLVGLMSSAVLTISLSSQRLEETDYSLPSARLFRLLVAGLVAMLVVSIAPQIQTWFKANQYIIWGALLLFGMGALQMGMTTHPVRTIIGLLTALAGFEIAYAAVESSLLVVGLLALVNLGLALAAVYILLVSRTEEQP